MRARPVFAVFLALLMLFPLVLADTGEDAKEIAKNWFETMGDYLASTPTKHGEMPGSTELIGVAKNSPDIVCGFATVMISDARLRLVLEFNDASDAGDYKEIERLANRISEVAKLSADVEEACREYFDSKDDIDYSSGEQTEETQTEEEESCPHNQGDTDVTWDIYNEATDDLREMVDAYDDQNGKYRDYISDYFTKKSGLESGLVYEEITCDQLDRGVTEARNYINFLVGRREKLSKAVWAVENFDIECYLEYRIWTTLYQIDKEMDQAVSTIAALKLIKKEKCEEEYSCNNLGEALEKQGDAVGDIPKEVAASIAGKKVNIRCGMFKIVNMSLIIDSKTGTTSGTVEVDESESNVYGVRFDENGAFTGEIIKGGWENPCVVVDLRDEHIESIMEAENAMAKILELWGTSITFKGTKPETQAQTGLLNLGNAIAKKLPAQVKPGWKAPPLQLRKPNKKNPFKMPKPRTLGTLALDPAKAVFNRAFANKRPANTCRIRNLEYNCYRNSLTLSPTTAERGSIVTVKAGSGFAFKGDVTLLAEPLGGASFGYTMLKISGNVIDDNTFQFNAHIPSGQYRIAAIVDNRPLDDYADSSQTLTVSGMAPTDVPGKIGESCDNRKCVSGAVCAAKYTYGGGRRNAPSSGYTCIDKKDYTAYCMPKGISPAAYHCIV